MPRIHPLGVWAQLLPPSGAGAEGSLTFPPARLQRTEHGGPSKACTTLRESPTGSTAHPTRSPATPLRSQGHAQLRRGQESVMPPSAYRSPAKAISGTAVITTAVSKWFQDRLDFSIIWSMEKKLFHFQKILDLCISGALGLQNLTGGEQKSHSSLLRKS